MNLDRRLLRLARQARLPMLAAVLLGLAGGGLAIAQARLLSQVIGQAFLRNASLAESTPLLGSVFCLLLLRAGAGWWQEIASSSLARRVKLRLRERYTGSLFSRSPADLRAARAGELLAIFQDGIEALDAYFSQYLPQLVLAALLPLLYLVFIFPLDWISALVMLVTAPLLPLFMWLIGNLAQSVTRRQWLTLRRLSAFLLDVLQGITTLKVLGRSRGMGKAIADASQRHREATMSVLRVTFLSALALEMIATLSTAVIAVEVGLRLLYGRMDFEQAFFVLLLAPEFYAPLRTLGTRFHAGIAGVEAARKLFDYLPEDTPGGKQETSSIPHAQSTGKRSQLLGSPPEVVFQDVHFSYAQGRPVLQGVDIGLPAGKLTALVGLSGAGKSTLAELLLGFRQPQRGCIRVNGQPLGSIPQDAWLEGTAYLAQSPYLFNASVRDNLRLARPGASHADMEAACRDAHAHEFIARLPEGYDTQIGEGGARLSAGQAQRLALARALVKKAPLLILDESTAHLDVETETLVQSSLDGLRGNTTLLAIAHRMSTALAADQVVVLEDGRVVEAGSPAELLERKGAFYQLVQAPDVSPGEAREQEEDLLVPMPDTSALPGVSRDRAVEKTLTGPGTFLRVVKLALPQLPWIGLAACLGFATIASSVGLMSASAYIISAAALRPSIAELQVAIVGVRFFGIARGVFRYLERLVSHQTTFRLLAELRVWFYQAVEPLAPGGLLAARRGDLLQRILADISALESFYVRALAPPVVAFLTALALGGGLAGVGLRLAGAALLAWLLAGVGVPWMAAWRARRAGARSVRAAAALSAGFIEGIQASVELAVYRQVESHVRRLAGLSQAYAGEQRRLSRVNATQSALTNLIAHLGMLAVLAVGISLVERGALPGVYLAVVVLATLTSFEAATPLPQATQQLGSHLAAARRLFEVADQPLVVSEPVAPLPLPERFDFQVRDLTFRYPAAGDERAEAPILENISFDLPAGKKLALVGASGSGKSTLLNLFLRFCEAGSGAILLDGAHLAAYSGDALRRAIAVAPQHAYIFNATLRDNLMLGESAASQEALERATQRAGLTDFVASLPHVLDTWAGEGGTHLSAGERQRLSLARALLRPSPVLILDEPTAHLDALTEQAVMRAILDGLEGASLLLVTHRLVGMPAMDEILVLEAGRVVERGLHRELVSLGGRYQRMWEKQARRE